MAVFKCPSCGKPLNLPEGLRGSEVQCPACATTFIAPAPETPRAVPLPPPPDRPSRVTGPPSREPSSELDFEADKRDAAHYRVRKKVENAAAWLRTALICDALSDLGCCCPFLYILAGPGHVPRGDEIFMMVVGASLVLWVVLLVVMGVGTQQLGRRQGYGMAMTAAILAFIVGVKGLLQGAGFALGTIGMLAGGGRDSCVAIPVFLVALAALAATIAGLGGGVKALMVLQDPQVYREFR